MLRVELNHDGTGSLAVRLQGRLVGMYAEEVRATMARYTTVSFILVDVSDVTFVDALGEKVLSWLGCIGARFVAANLYTRGICERLQLQVSEQHPESGSGTDTQVLA